MKSELPGKAAAIAEWPAVRSMGPKLNVNTSGVLDHLILRSCFPILDRRVVYRTARLGRLGEGDKHARNVFHVN